jgi:hypothetical protein
VLPSQATEPGPTQAAPLQQSCVGEQAWFTFEQVGGGVQAHPVALVQTLPVASRQFVFSPGQQGCVGEHEGSGVWPVT